METKILIAVPTFETIHHTVATRICQLILNNPQYKFDTLISSMRGIGEHRNMIVKEFLKTDADYLLFIDSDNPPPVNVLDLVALDLDVVGCPTPINMNWGGDNDFNWNVFDADKTPTPIKGKGLEEVIAIGTGCILIARRVLEKIKNPFTEIRDGSGVRIIGTDVAFCDRCKDNGFKIYAHWNYICDHYKQINLKTLI